MVMILIACTGAFAYLLTFYQVPTKMSEFLLGVSDNSSDD
jgi:TRAP-type C4-dicarboxylate transport system permease large subunit